MLNSPQSIQKTRVAANNKLVFIEFNSRIKDHVNNNIK
jgi:hypothetical protein